jgi:hypothetical protein
MRRKYKHIESIKQGSPLAAIFEKLKKSPPKKNKAASK